MPSSSNERLQHGQVHLDGRREGGMDERDGRCTSTHVLVHEHHLSSPLIHCICIQTDRQTDTDKIGAIPEFSREHFLSHI